MHRAFQGQYARARFRPLGPNVIDAVTVGPLRSRLPRRSLPGASGRSDSRGRGSPRAKTRPAEASGRPRSAVNPAQPSPLPSPCHRCGHTRRGSRKRVAGASLGRQLASPDAVAGIALHPSLLNWQGRPWQPLRCSAGLGVDAIFEEMLGVTTAEDLPPEGCRPSTSGGRSVFEGRFNRPALRSLLHAARCSPGAAGPRPKYPAKGAKPSPETGSRRRSRPA